MQLHLFSSWVSFCSLEAGLVSLALDKELAFRLGTRQTGKEEEEENIYKSNLLVERCNEDRGND